MVRVRRQGGKRPVLAPATPPSSCKGAMLLYEAPTGIAIFSFDDGYLDKQVEDFWACIPQLVLRVFMNYYRNSTFFDFDNGAIDKRLAKRLTMWCGSKKKLIVGSAKYKKIIEENLEITCLCLPDDEVVSGLKNPAHILLPEEKTETTKEDLITEEEKSETTKNSLLTGEEAILLLGQHGIDVKPEMVNESLVEAAQRVHRIELRQKEHLKFLRILLKDFMVKSGVDTTDWKLIHFATALKFICRPEASYEISYPNEIYSYDEYLKIETNAPLYKRSFSKIDSLAVYEDFLSLRTELYGTLFKLDLWVEAEVTRLCKDHFSGEPNRIDLPTTDSYPLEAPNRAEPTHQVIPSESCAAEGHHCLVPDKVQEKLAANMDGVDRSKQIGDTGVQSMDDYGKKLTANMDGVERNNQVGDTGVQSMDDCGKKLTASALVLLGNKKDEHTDASVKEMNLPESIGDDGKNKHSRGTEGIHATSMSSKSEYGPLKNLNGDGKKQKEVIPATKEMLKYGLLKDLNGDGKKRTASTPGPLGKQDEHTDTSKQEMKQPVGEKENVQSIASGKKKPRPVGEKENVPTSTRYNSGFNVLNKGIIATSSSSNSGPDKENEKIPTTSKIPKSGPLKVQRTDTSVKNLREVNDDHTNYGKARDDTKIPEITRVDEDKMANPASGEITQSGRLRDLLYEEMAREANEVLQSGKSSGGKTPPYKAGRRSKAMKQDIVDFFLKNMVSENLGLICNAHVVHADLSEYGAKDEKCIRLAELAATAVDFPKTGKLVVMPSELRPKIYPDFMLKEDSNSYKSEKILGRLYRSIQEASGGDLVSEEAYTSNDVPYDTDLEVPGASDFIADAWQCKCSYEAQLNALLHQYRVRTEAELVTGHIWSLTKTNSRKQGEIKEKLKNAYNAFKKEYRSIFESITSDECEISDDEKSRWYEMKASAWYQVTYHPKWIEKSRAMLDPDNEEMPVKLSFAWVAVDYLVRIKLRCHGEVKAGGRMPAEKLAAYISERI